MAKLKNKRKKAGNQRKQNQTAIPGESLPKNYNDQIQSITAMAMSIIYSEENDVEKKLLPDAFKRAKDTVEHPEDVGPLAVADVTLWVIEQIEKQVESKKKQIKPVIIAGAIGSVAPQVAEVGMVAGIDMSKEDIQVSIAVAINKFIAIAKKEGRVKNQELVEAAKALEKEYPEEVAEFNQMIQQRQQRQKTSLQNRGKATQPASPQQGQNPQQGTMGPETLLQNRPVAKGVL